ncbi:AmmeMemoRadiSam system protein A [Allochromatium vinosum]|uniref:AMMECR1 domain protein n=1 Tax=Allochromatium vinosum (strain ATCC 17899 / DSM 180 / NBRC 103801 / NCIMB 10441 / D) TaxID=572477 RepID=D3RQ98_ALLVD|nr:AmmeMemoRadiSam system protein A [Allochromatium vinosum]ADC61703.1 AMMECR1 domain protein [Allochromatium vinosum DSM 180]MBK1653822.1 AmmeMemoRadiSam system protein A [Allochromatium vinosum]
MAPMPSIETAGERPVIYDATERAILLDIAARSIAHGLAHQRPLDLDPAEYPESLRAIRATFVTLERHADLRGCIGVLDAFRPLVTDVTRNAFAAAFEDPRFPPLRAAEYPELTLKLSVLTPAEPLTFGSEVELLAQIRPGVDGLILSDRGRRGTFLPSVWEQLPNPRDFLDHLKRKAGLPMGHWSDSLRVSRYGTESFGGPIDQIQRPA